MYGTRYLRQKLKTIFLKSISERSKGWILKKIEAIDLTLLLNLDSYIDYLISVQGNYDKATLHKIHKLISDDNNLATGEVLFFDIGSNIGLMSLYISKKEPETHIYAFEPISQNFHQNQMNQIINSLNYSLYKLLLGKNNKDTVKVYLSDPLPNREYGKTNMGASSVYLRENNSAQKYEVCEMITFDKFWLENIDIKLKNKIKKCVIKIDVEGSELDVILGMTDFLNVAHNFQTILIVELLFDSLKEKCKKVVDLMKKQGYSFYNYTGEKIERIDSLEPGNYIFSNEENIE